MEPPQASMNQHNSDDHLHEPAAARSGDERESGADERESRLDAREVRADARDAAQAVRRKHALRILADATERDDQADARDSAATSRDTAAGRHSFLTDSEGQFDPAFKARRSAAMDRLESKADRTAAAADRSELTRGDPGASDTEDDNDHAT